MTVQEINKLAEKYYYNSNFYLENETNNINKYYIEKAFIAGINIGIEIGYEQNSSDQIKFEYIQENFDNYTPLYEM